MRIADQWQTMLSAKNVILYAATGGSNVQKVDMVT